MFCINCGTKMNPDAKFCANCGAAKASVSPPEPQPPEPSPKKKVPIWIPIVASTAAIALIVVINAIIGIFGNENGNNNGNMDVVIDGEQLVVETPRPGVAVPQILHHEGEVIKGEIAPVMPPPVIYRVGGGV